MGNSDSKDSKAKATKVKGPAPTFGRNPDLNPADFIITAKKNEIIFKSVGSIKGQQFIIEECNDCDIFLVDHIASLTIDLCTNCRIFTGPVESSIFIRDCNKCDFVLICQQLRFRDCQNIRAFVFTTTGPIIETSKHITFGNYFFNYSGIIDNFTAAGLNIWNNSWYDVYDFNTDYDRGNYSLMSLVDLMDTKPPITLTEGVLAALVEHGVDYYTVTSSDSFIPKTVGLRPNLTATTTTTISTGFISLYIPTPTPDVTTDTLVPSKLSGLSTPESQLIAILQNWVYNNTTSIATDSITGSTALEVPTDKTPIPSCRWLTRTVSRLLSEDQLRVLSEDHISGTDSSRKGRSGSQSNKQKELFEVYFAEVVATEEDLNILSQLLTELTVSKLAVFYKDKLLAAQKIHLVFEEWKIVM